jgi:hypothetical protein
MISDKPAQNQQGSGGVDPKEFQKYFEKHLRFTAGMGTQYQPSSLTGPSTHQHLASGLLVGMRFHSAPVIRITDAKRVQLGHAAKADGRWRLYAFAGADDHRNDSKGVGALCKFLEQSADSPLRLYTPRLARISTRSLTCGQSSSKRTMNWPLSPCPRCCCRARGAMGCATTKKFFALTRKVNQTFLTCVASTGRRAAWYWSDLTNTLLMSCH